ncbi:MAG: hypothetical protein JSU59_02300, partial [Nitrospirota bacterium]
MNIHRLFGCAKHFSLHQAGWSDVSRNILRPFIILLLLLPTGCTDLKKLAYEGFNRDEWQKPEEVIQALAIQPGDHIADLGSGSG